MNAIGISHPMILFYFFFVFFFVFFFFVFFFVFFFFVFFYASTYVWVEATYLRFNCTARRCSLSYQLHAHVSHN
jgi:hypothetical protein